MQDIILRILSVLKQPRKFFAGLKKEKGIAVAFRYNAILLAVFTVLSLVLGGLFQPVTRSALSSILNMPIPQPEMTLATLIVATIVGYVLSLALSFVSVGILHLWILLWGGRQPYVKAYQLFAYAATPTLIVGWLPVVNLFTGVYSLVLYIIGTQEMYKLSKMKSILMYVIPVVLFFVIWFVVMLFVLTEVKTLS